MSTERVLKKGSAGDSPAPVGDPPSICLASSLRERPERGVYAASAWHIRCDVVEFPEPRGIGDREAA